MASKKQSKKLDGAKGGERKLNTKVALRKVSDSKESAQQCVRRFLGLVHPILQEAASINAARQVLARYPGDTKDSKGDPLESRAAANAAQLKLVKSNLASMYGTKAVPFRLAISFGINSSGVTTSPAPFAAYTRADGVLGITPTVSVEWPDMMALFDEFRVVKGKMLFNNTFTSPEMTPGLGVSLTLAPDLAMVLAFDPADGVNLTSLRNGCEIEQHKMFGSVVTDNRVSSFSTRVQYERTDARPLEFDFHIPKGDAIFPASGLVSAADGVWLPTATSVTSVVYTGYIKQFSQTNLTTAVSLCSFGVLYLDILVRCRS
jgi:hypothetical protein